MSGDEGFFREVDEDYRKHQATEFLKKYGAYLIGAAVVIVAVVAGYSIEKYYATRDAQRGGDAFVSAMTLADDGNDADAEKALKTLADTGPAAYKVLARLSLASEAVAKKQKDAAIVQFRSVADDATASADLRDYARIQVAALSVDTESYDAMAKQLEKYRNGTNAWRFTAKELLGLSALKAGRKDEAEKLFQEIYSDGAAPQGTRQRAEVMLALTLEKPKAAAAKKSDGAMDAKTQ